ncbi:concanavalin-like precursor [Cotia virus SPAn232]|uniref:Concanavalin-like n=2 Tax=Cotia virus TaxID=39444 RepID=H6TAB1_9POXV|nr:concanavalin-like precursor [Cotia virus SPAn232]AFB76945.1 concanavalin-like precursor [Cotia virus SPAn232]AIT70758.1 concanavalin-like precursor [Cotia virus]
MFKYFYLTKNIIKHIDGIIEKGIFIEDDSIYFKKLLNNLFGYNDICNISNMSLVLLDKKNYIHSFKFDKINILPRYEYTKRDNSIIEANNYIFCICLEGSVFIEQNNKYSNFIKIINRGECFILNTLSDYLIHTFDPRLKLVVVSYVSLYPFIHYNNKIICSVDENLYEIFDGYRFAIFSLFDENNISIERIIAVNGKYYDIKTLSELDIFGLNSILIKYNIVTNYLLLNSMYYQKTNLHILNNILNDNKIFNDLINNTQRIYAYSNDSKLYSIMLVYGIMNYNT